MQNYRIIILGPRLGTNLCWVSWHADNTTGCKDTVYISKLDVLRVEDLASKCVELDTFTCQPHPMGTLPGSRWSRTFHTRSQAQKDHLRRLNTGVTVAHHEVDKENGPGMVSIVHQWEKQTAEIKKRYLNERRHAERVKKAFDNVQEHAQVIKGEAQCVGLAKQELEKWLGDASEEINVLWKKNHALVMRVRHFPAQKSLAVKTALAKTQGSLHMVKEKEVIKDTFRDLVLDLVADSVGVEHVNPIVKRVAGAVGVELQGDISMRSVSRIVLEGGVTSKMQIVDHVERSTSM
ncbi:hypothetical protein K439DRAFT_1623087 [Ramaria rubella]|nr:hypothetical protein K439DRAFT_1623087 [Ramaria rubella]